MAEDSMGISVPNPLNIIKNHDYRNFVVECAKDLFASTFFDLAGSDSSSIDEAKIAADSVRRAELLAMQLHMEGYMDTPEIEVQTTSSSGRKSAVNVAEIAQNLKTAYKKQSN